MSGMSRRERARLATIGEILDIARGQLAGHEDVSLRGIAREMGMTAPALYRYFANVEALTRVLAGEEAIELQGQIGDAIGELYDDADLDTKLTPADEWAAAWRVLRSLAADRPAVLRMMLLHPDITEAVLATVDKHVEAWAATALTEASR